MITVGLWLAACIIVGYIGSIFVYLVYGLLREGGSRAAFAVLLLVAAAVIGFIVWVVR